MTDPRACEDRVAQGEPPGDDCLRRATRHICHDLYLMQLAWKKQQDPVAYTMWFITVRGLMDFFFKDERSIDFRRTKDEEEKRHKDDVLAADYLADGVWKDVAEGLCKNKKPEDYSTVRETANKLAAHLTYSRVDQEEISVSPSESVHAFIRDTADRWIEELSPDRRKWINDRLEDRSDAELEQLLDEGRGSS